MRYELLLDWTTPLGSMKMGALMMRKGAFYVPETEEGGGIFTLDKDLVEDNPTWFRKVEEKEYTERDMIAFVRHVVGLYRRTCDLGCGDPSLPIILAEWLKSKRQP